MKNNKSDNYYEPDSQWIRRLITKVFSQKKRTIINKSKEK